jgi:hypothetical protein
LAKRGALGHCSESNQTITFAKKRWRFHPHPACGHLLPEGEVKGRGRARYQNNAMQEILETLAEKNGEHSFHVMQNFMPS